MALGVKYVIFCVVFSLTVVSGIDFAHLSRAKTEANQEDALVKWRKIEDKMISTIDSLVKQALPLITGSGADTNFEISDGCTMDLMNTYFAVKKLKLWALKLLDSSGKPPSGAFRGSVSALGNYDQCLNLVFPREDEDDPDEEQTKGKYCLVDIGVPLPPKPNVVHVFQEIFTIPNSTFKTEAMEEMRRMAFGFYYGGFRLAVCLPSTCTSQDLENILASAIKTSDLQGSIYSCEVKKPFAIDNVQIGVITAFSFIVLLNIIATAFDALFPGNDEKFKKSYPRRLLDAFSFSRNVKSVSKLEGEGAGILECMNGLRVISMTWVILGHTYATVEPHLFQSVLEADGVRKNLLFQAIGNGQFSVESFYLITSVLVSYNLVKVYDSIGKHVFNIPIIILKRIWRLTPSLFYLIGITILLPLMSSGPFWNDTTMAMARNCRERWYFNTLYINNYQHFGKSCAPHTWYLAVDMQLFIFALVYLFLLFKKPLWGKVFLFLMTIVSIVVTAMVIYLRELPPTAILDVIDVDFMFDYAFKLYGMPFVHMGVYAAGLATGTFLARQQKFKISRWTSCILWLCATVIALSLVYGPLEWNSGRIPTMLETFTYGPLQRTLWGGSIAWVIIACATGYGGPVNSLLSWQGFRPLVRISFMMYLVHIPVQMAYVAQRRSPIETSLTVYTWMFFGHLGVTVIAALIMRVIFEAPLGVLDGVFFDWLKTKKKSEEKDYSNSKIVFNGSPSTQPEGIVNGSYTSNL